MTGEPEFRVTDRRTRAEMAREAAREARERHKPEPVVTEESLPVNKFIVELRMLSGDVFHTVPVSEAEVMSVYQMLNNDVGKAGNLKVHLNDGRFLITRADHLDYALATLLPSDVQPGTETVE